MDSQVPDSQCSKLSSHHPPLIAYHPVSLTIRAHRLDDNLSLTHFSFHPRPEAAPFSPSSPLSRHSCNFHARFLFHLSAQKSLPPRGRLGFMLQQNRHTTAT